MTKISNPTTSRKPVFIGFIAAVILIGIGSFMLWQRYQILIESRQREMAGIIDVVEQNIDQSLKYSYSAALSLALQIDENGEIDNFEEFASQLVESNPNIDAIETVPNGIIKEVYPYEENKDAINYNILEDSTRNEEAFKAIEKQRMFFAGPFELKQGGLAIVGRLPVFIKDKFWGFSAVIIHFENLIDQSGINELANEKYRFQFSKVNPVTDKEEFFLDGIKGLDRSYSEVIILPDGDWKVYIIPVNPDAPLRSIIPVIFLIIFLGIAFGWIIYNAMKQPVILAEKLKEQAADLEQSELHFRTIFNQAAIGMARVDSNTGMILETNQKLQELLGYTDEEFRQMEHTAISYPSDKDINVQLFKKLCRNEIREYNLKKRLIRRDGQSIWIKLNVSALWPKGEKPTSHIALVEDISARVQAKKELIDNEKRFRALVENSNEVILILNDVGSPIYNSPSLKRITGYDDLKNFGEDILSFVHKNDQKFVRDKLKLAMRNHGTPISDVIMRVRTQTDRWIWMNATITNLLNEKKVEGFVVNLRDITEKKQAEINLMKSYDFVMEQNKRLLNFAYIVSHNLRSHSSNLESILELYGMEDSEEEKENYIELLNSVSKNLNQSLHDLNEVVSINTNIEITTEKLKVSDYLDKTIEVLKLQIRQKNAEIINEVPEDMVVSFNVSYLESILLNFITNALRYSKKGRDPKIVVKGYLHDDQWVLAVSDNGIGIDMKRHGDKVFGLYKTFSNRSDSRGVGLFITKNQINAMGGDVTVESEVNVGTTFKVFFK
ncbi:PAS domain S-box protein [Christiangramia salexigens]|uniref:histidine kinase n=1 Tax=Christiangramia salexigens TaxID=1913577 RepID=A0A1L3J5K2_9FLAO|nr:PAS domain S-box protein [Christiangramia salexigens]APG60418.1 histidine kinase [Christiangramia salexigens]